MTGFDLDMFAADVQGLAPGDGESLLGLTQQWLGTFVKTAQPHDLHTLTLWAAHTHVVRHTYTSPRLLLDSPAPGSGKTTVLDHLNRVAFHPVQAASLSSPSLLARLLEKSPRTILIDEADRTLNPKAEGVGELLAVLNSGYRFGASRPVLVQVAGGNWEPVEMSTFGPVAMAGNAPDLPPDTRSRCIRVLLLPDLEGAVLDSDWQEIEPYALMLNAAFQRWAELTGEDIAAMKPDYAADGLGALRGRNRERWAPLYKVALAAGGDWPGWCRELIRNDLEEQEMDAEAGLVAKAPHLVLLGDIAEVWPKGAEFMPTTELVNALRWHKPDVWGAGNQRFGELKPQGMGRMLVKHFSIRAARKTGGERERGYYRATFEPSWGAFGIPVPDGSQ